MDPKEVERMSHELRQRFFDNKLPLEQRVESMFHHMSLEINQLKERVKDLEDKASGLT